MKMDFSSDDDMDDLQDKWDDMTIQDAKEGDGEDGLEYKYRVMSIDVGITNLGISISLHSHDWSSSEIVLVDLIDLARVKHKRVPKKKCSLYHTNHIVDRIEHFFQEWEPFFSQCEYILVEQQPIMGITSVEALIFQRYRDKTHLIHPTRMHKHFRISDLEYEQRKEKTVEIASRELKNDSELMKSFNSHTRRHDIADSICLQKYWSQCVKRRTFLADQKKKTNIDLFEQHRGMSMDDYFNTFKYKGPLT